MTVIECIVADGTGFVKLSAYNKTTFPMLKTGRSIVILNSICKPKEIVLTTDAKALLILPVDVGAEIESSAQQIITQLNNPSAAEEKSVIQILDLLPGTLVTCTVKVIQVSDAQTVTTKYGGQTEVRNGVVADETGAIPFAFWKNLAGLPFSEEDCIKVSGGIVCKTTDRMPKLSGNQRTIVEVLPKDAVLLSQVLTGTKRKDR